jgi:hypothetical protein
MSGATFLLRSVYFSLFASEKFRANNWNRPKKRRKAKSAGSSLSERTGTCECTRVSLISARKTLVKATAAKEAGFAK